MEMLSFLYREVEWEKGLFFWVNGTHCVFADQLMWTVSRTVVWLPVALYFLSGVVYKKNLREWLPVLFAIVLLFVCCDQLSSSVMKPLFARPRPTHFPGIMEYVRVLHGYRGGLYGFVSGHATNSFGFAVFSALLLKNRFYAVFILFWAFLISYSRVYLGVHFVSDVIGGAVMGALIGFVIYQFLVMCCRPYYSIRTSNRITFFSVVYLLVVFFIACCGAVGMADSFDAAGGFWG